jgi:type I restriction enzyme S subunit
VALISRIIHERMSGTHVQQQDVLLNITGASIGRCALVPAEFVEGNVSQHVAIIRLVEPSIREFVHLLLISPFLQKVIADVEVGVSREGLSMQRLQLFPMLIPPVAEQRRIVAKVDELMALCNRLEASQTERERRRDRLAAASLHRLNQTAAPDEPESFRKEARFYLNHLSRLTTRPEQVKQLRETILNLAVRGRLVPQNSSDEPAAALLSRTAARKAKTGRDWLGDLAKPLGNPFCVPEGWAWTRIAMAVQRVTVGHVGPMKDLYVEDGIPFLRSQNVRANRFREDGLIRISRQFHHSLAKSALAPGDVVVVRSGNVGTACVIPPSLPEANCADLVVVKGPSAVLPEYLCFYLNSLAATHIEQGSVGVALTHFNTRSVATMPLPLPPFAEQHRIVSKVNGLMSLCDQLESRLTDALTEGRHLIEAILRRALDPTPQEQPLVTEV